MWHWPPWYLTWWAFTAYIILAGLGIRYLVIYREHIQRKKMEERRKNSELKAAQDLQKSMLPKEYPKREDLEIHAFIRGLISEKYGPEMADEISILYGGSCKASNAKELFANPDVDGGLIGGASLDADEFFSIIQSF